MWRAAMTNGIPDLMRAQMQAEWEIAHAPQLAELDRYRNALGGIASCASHCAGCQMLAEVARRALADAGTPATPDD